jgi:hypothetical protein
MQFTLRYEPDEIDVPYKGGYNGDKSGEIDEGMWELPRQQCLNRRGLTGGGAQE